MATSYTLPANLNSGYISVTGGSSINNITTNDKDIQFGVVRQIYTDTPSGFLTGDSVMFKISEAVTVVTYSNVQYFLLQTEKIILTEIELT